MPSNPHRPTGFLCSYEADTAAIHDARRAFLSWLGDWVEDGELHEDMLVVLSELMANAVGASDEPRSDILIRAWIDADGLTLRVTNPPASTFTAVNRWDYNDPLRGGGRGLLIVESLVDDLAITPPNGPEPLSICCRRELSRIP